MFLMRQELCSSSIEGRGQPTFRWAAFFFCAARETSTDTEVRDALYCDTAIGGHQQSLRDVVLPENPQ